MQGLMMDFQLTLPAILRRAETYFPQQEIVTRLPDRSFHRYTFADAADRSKRLAVALRELGLERGAGWPRSAGITISTSRRTSGFRAAASSSTRSISACTRTTSPTSHVTVATAR